MQYLMLELQHLLLPTFQPIMYQVLLEPNVLVPVAGGTLLLFISTPNRKGATVTAAIPLARNAIPSIL
jgi:hypothetical protein